jgi:hypothetical protein
MILVDGAWDALVRQAIMAVSYDRDGVFGNET